jgi:hypothetical protein
MNTGLFRHGLVVAVVWLLASPCLASEWDDLVASHGAGLPSPAVRDYLKASPLVSGAPTPSFREIRTETFDGSIAQQLKLTRYDGYFGHVEGMREVRAKGARSGGVASQISMETALGGLVLVWLENKSAQSTVFLRQIKFTGELLPPSDNKPFAMKYERVQLQPETIFEELHDCAFKWTEPNAQNPILESRCTGSIRTSKRQPNGAVEVVTEPQALTQSFVFRRDLGWIFNQNTRILDFKRASQ